MARVRAWAADGPKETFKPTEYELGPIGGDEVDIAVENCGLCHSDYSIWTNEWGVSQYPFVGGHEVIGRIKAKGDFVSGLEVGQKVGLGWISRSDLNTQESLAGDHNLSPGNETTIVGRHGGFADTVRCQALWAIPLPDDLDANSAGPLFCGGITVFNPIVQLDIKPTDKVAVIGIGGLGHLALQFLNRWGCEVTAFTSSESKAQEAKSFGAHHILSSHDKSEWKKARGRFDLILSTVAVDLDWEGIVKMLTTKGRLHMVGLAPNPVSLRVMSLMTQQRSFSASPTGAPAVTRKMLEFCARHDIAPQTEIFPMSKINEAMAHLEAGKARYRIILENDF